MQEIKLNVLAAWHVGNSECNAWHGEHMHNKQIQSKKEDKIVDIKFYRNVTGSVAREKNGSKSRM